MNSRLPSRTLVRNTKIFPRNGRTPKITFIRISLKQCLEASEISLWRHLTFTLGPPAPKQNIAIFGHNHNDEMWADFWCTDRLLKTLPIASKDSPSDLIYVNCGTWVDSKDHCTYVETEENIAEKRHYVRLLEYPGPKLLKKRFVEL